MPGREQLTHAENEIATHSGLSHPSILPLLESQIVSSSSRGGAGNRRHPSSQNSTSASHISIGIEDEPASESCGTALLVLPALPDGDLAKEVERLRGMPPIVGQRHRGLASHDILDIFMQARAQSVKSAQLVSFPSLPPPNAKLCDALIYLHEVKGLAHLDVKPHNLLIERPAGEGIDRGRGVDGGRGGEASRDKESGACTASALSAPKRPCSYRVFLTDFGSAEPRMACPSTRRDALSLQDQAAAHCTATYRAPELWDVPTGLPLDLAKCDIWAAGCTFFHVMYGCSPFQQAADQPGGSIALAALNCSVPWPKEGR